MGGRSAERFPDTTLMWGVFALALDVAVGLHGFIVIFIVSTGSRPLPPSLPQFQIDGRDAVAPSQRLPDLSAAEAEIEIGLMFLTFAWLLAITAAFFAAWAVVRAPMFHGRRHSI